VDPKRNSVCEGVDRTHVAKDKIEGRVLTDTEIKLLGISSPPGRPSNS